MNDIIPERYKAIIGAILTVIVAVLAVVGEWQDMGAVPPL